MRRRLAVAVGLFALAELLLALLVGRLLDWARAEPLLFFAFRPWLLLALAVAVRDLPWRIRIGTVAAALLAASLGEAALLVSLGGWPWLRLGAGLAAGLGLALAVDLLLAAAARPARRWLRALAPVALAMALFVPGVLAPFEAVALWPNDMRPVRDRPPLLLMTGLPLVWGEGGAFDPASRPAAVYLELEREFAVTPIDQLSPAALTPARLLLLAQPRALAPTELAALDAWVRAGGRVLILADPSLVWPSELPPGDVRRAPAVSLLTPLLDHWGLRLEPWPGSAPRTIEVHGPEDVRRLAVQAPGRFAATHARCRAAGWQAQCAIGAGRADLVADADLLRDDLWAAPYARGAERHARLADNPLVIADRLDRLAAVDRPRAARPVDWRSPGGSKSLAVILGLLPGLLILVLAAFRLPTGLSTGDIDENKERKSA